MARTIVDTVRSSQLGATLQLQKTSALATVAIYGNTDMKRKGSGHESIRPGQQKRTLRAQSFDVGVNRWHECLYNMKHVRNIARETALRP